MEWWDPSCACLTLKSASPQGGNLWCRIGLCILKGGPPLIQMTFFPYNPVWWQRKWRLLNELVSWNHFNQGFIHNIFVGHHGGHVTHHLGHHGESNQILITVTDQQKPWWKALLGTKSATLLVFLDISVAFSISHGVFLGCLTQFCLQSTVLQLFSSLLKGHDKNWKPAEAKNKIPDLKIGYIHPRTEER